MASALKIELSSQYDTLSMCQVNRSRAQGSVRYWKSTGARCVMKSLNLIKSALSVSLLGVIVACSSNANDPLSDQVVVVMTDAPNDGPLIVTTEEQMATDSAAAIDMLNGTDFAPPGDPAATMLAADTGDLVPAVFASETDVDMVYAQAGAMLISSFNEAIALPADIAVNFIDCGTANAFYAPPGFNVETNSMVIAPGGGIFMCHELTAVFDQFFGNQDQAFAASVFVLMHEVGHALVNQLNLPLLGIEESYVDGVAAVLVGESGLAEASVLAGFFFGEQSDNPFFDSHRAGPQRLGDLACWGIGANTDFLQNPFIASIAEQLIAGGRDCVGEYAQQVSALQSILGTYIRGGLTNVFATPALPQNSAF